MIARTALAAALLATAVAAMPGSAEASSFTHVGQTAKVVGVSPYSVLNVRAKPSLYGHKVGSIPGGAHGVHVHGCVTGWCKVSYAGCTGWAAERFLAWW